MNAFEILSLTIEQIAALPVERILSALVQIPSVNPLWQSNRSGIANEKAKAEFLKLLFDKLRNYATVDIDYITDDRPNVMVRIQVDDGNWTVWDTHIDTVGVDNMTIEPFAGLIAEGKVWGRGSCDTLASAAIAIKLIFEAASEGKMPNTNLLLVFTMGEENGGEGAKELPRWLRQQGIVVKEWITSEPTVLTPVYAHNGVTRGNIVVSNQNTEIGGNENEYWIFEITVKGRSGHTSNPDLANNALYLGASFCQQLRREDFRVTLSGGQLGNTVPNECHMIVAADKSRYTTSDAAIEVINRNDGKLAFDISEITTQRNVNWDQQLVDAVCKIILAVQSEHSRLQTEGLQSVTGRPVISVPAVHFDGQNATISIDRRNVPGEDPQQILDALLKRLQESTFDGKIEVSIAETPYMRRLPGFASDPNSAFIQRLVALTGNTPTTAKYGTNLLFVDNTVFVNNQVVAVVIGPGDIAQAHTEKEFIEIKQVRQHLRIMAEFFGLN